MLVSRSLLRLRGVALPEALSTQDRWSALRAQALAWQPFGRTQSCFALQGKQGWITAWDGDVAERALADVGLGGATLRFIPETAFQPEPVGVVQRLIQGVEGFEAQSWSDGVLQASRWWLNKPELTEWQEFLRLLPAEVPRTEVMPASERAAAERPNLVRWRAPEDDGDTARRRERWLVGGCAFVLVLASMPVLREQWELRREVQHLEERLQQQRKAAQPALKARADTMAMAEKAASLQADLEGVQALQVMAHLSDVLPKQGVVLKEFDLDGQKLRLVFELAQGVSRTSLVEQLQQGGWFAEVVEQQTAPRQGWVAYAIQLSGHVPPPFADAPASAGARP